MKHEYVIFLGASIACYLAALSVNGILVQWVLPARKTQDTNRYLAIDGIRGYLAFGVFLHHSIVTWFYLQSGSWQEPQFNFAKQLGGTSVAIFFMITSFLFWGRILETRNGMDWTQFFVSRIFRIYPLYIFAVLIVVTAVGYKGGWTANESFRTIVREMLQWLVFRHPDVNHFKNTAIIIAGVNWTLQYELWFYLALPFLACAILLKNPIWKKLIYLLIVGALFVANHLSRSIAATFFGGIVAAYWVRDPRRRSLAQGKVAAIAGLVCFGIVFFLAHGSYNVISLVLLSIFFITIASGNTLFGLLSTKAALWMGEISYGIYLLHGILLWAILQNMLPSLPVLHSSPYTFALATLAATPIVILVSSATFLLIERPFIAWGKGFLGRGFRYSDSRNKIPQTAELTYLTDKETEESIHTQTRELQNR